VALQAQDLKGAEGYFGVMLEKVPNSEYKGTMRFLLGNTRFMQGNFDGALKAYRKHLEEFPAGPEAEEARSARSSRASMKRRWGCSKSISANIRRAISPAMPATG